MMEDNLTRDIKVFCPTHQSVFEVADAPKIVCEIREHALSDNFPHADFWEYCADCQTFSPSDLEVGGKGKPVCGNCERPTMSRFICGNCKVVCNDSGESTKGKIFTVNTDSKTIEPACPGCLEDFSDANLLLHRCEEAETVFLTSRQTCPFCKKETTPPAKKKPLPKTSDINCPNCKTVNPADNIFCLNCGNGLRPESNVEKRGTTTAKTQLLGSICPTCGVTNEANSVFCPNCGQSLRSKKPIPTREIISLPPLPPPPPKVINANQLGNVRPPTPPKSSNAKGCLIVFGILFGAIMLCSVCQGITGRKNSTTSTTSTSYTPTSTPYSDYNSNSYSANAYNPETSKTDPTPMNTSPTPEEKKPDSSLPKTFNNDFTGKIGGKYFTMSLTRDGNSLSGTASTYKTDSVRGTIDNSGNFTLEGFEEDSYYSSGTYKGRIKTDGSISGTWTNSDGEQRVSFYLTEN